MKEIKTKRRLLFSLLLAFLFISVDIFVPGIQNTLTGGSRSSIVYAKPRTSSSGFKSGSFKSTTKSSSFGKSKSSTSTKSSKSSSGSFKSGLFSTPKSSTKNSSSSTKNSTSSSYSSSSSRRSYIPIPIPWGSSRYNSSSYYGPGFGIRGIASGFVRFIVLLIIIIVVLRIIKNNRRRF